MVQCGVSEAAEGIQRGVAVSCSHFYEITKHEECICVQVCIHVHVVCV